MSSPGSLHHELLSRELDPGGVRQRLRVREERFQRGESPRQRALVMSVVTVLVWLHVAVLPHGGLPEDALLYTGVAVGYAGLAALALRACSTARPGVHAALQLCDLAVLAFAVWCTGAEASWLFLLPALGATELHHTTVRGTALVTLTGTIVYAGVLLLAMRSGHGIDPGLEAVKLGAMLVIGLRLASTARAAERGRDDLQAVVERSREVMLQLEDHEARSARDHEAMQSAMRERNEFLACMSHEIRTPLNGVLGMVELTLATALTDPQTELMHTARGSTLSLLRVIDDIVDYAALDEGRLELAPAPCSLREVVATATGTVSGAAGEKLLELRTHVDPAVPEWIEADGERIAQVLGKLLDNAVAFTDTGHVQVEVELDEAPDGDGPVTLHLIVSDTGIGIPEAKRERIFEPFTQADGTTRRIHGGTGLGLALAAMLVDLMGGRLWVESDVGQGSRFHLSLPAEVTTAPTLPAATALPPLPPAVPAPRRHGGPTLRLRLPDAPRETLGPAAPEPSPRAAATGPEAHATSTDAPTGSASPSTPSSPLSRSPSRTLDLLLVEDNPVNQLVARRMLESWGHRVAVAENGQRGLDALDAGPFDAVLMDIAMPVMDGFEATRKVRLDEQRRGGHLPIIAMTAHASPGDRQRCLDGGMDDYVTKPVKPHRLFEALERVAETLGVTTR